MIAADGTVRRQSLKCDRCGKPLYLEETNQIKYSTYIKREDLKCSSCYDARVSKMFDFCPECFIFINNLLLENVTHYDS